MEIIKTINSKKNIILKNKSNKRKDSSKISKIVDVELSNQELLKDNVVVKCFNSIFENIFKDNFYLTGKDRKKYDLQKIKNLAKDILGQFIIYKSVVIRRKKLNNQLLDCSIIDNQFVENKIDPLTNQIIGYYQYLKTDNEKITTDLLRLEYPKLYESIEKTFPEKINDKQQYDLAINFNLEEAFRYSLNTYDTTSFPLNGLDVIRRYILIKNKYLEIISIFSQKNALLDILILDKNFKTENENNLKLMKGLMSDDWKEFGFVISKADKNNVTKIESKLEEKLQHFQQIIKFCNTQIREAMGFEEDDASSKGDKLITNRRIVARNKSYKNALLDIFNDYLFKWSGLDIKLVIGEEDIEFKKNTIDMLQKIVTFGELDMDKFIEYSNTFGFNFPKGLIIRSFQKPDKNSNTHLSRQTELNIQESGVKVQGSSNEKDESQRAKEYRENK